MQRVLQGTDAIMQPFRVRDNAGVVIPVASILDTRVVIYTLNNNSKCDVFEFAKTPTGVQKALIVVDTEIQGFVIDREINKNWKGVHYAEIKVKLNASADYISSFIQVGSDGYQVCEMIVSANHSTL